MSDAGVAALLRDLLVGQYDEIKRQLTQRLGSEDLAGEVLQETYLQLKHSTRLGAVARPKQYLLAVATNIARMRFRRERRWTSLSELDAALGFVDEAPSQLQAAEGRQEIEALQRAFHDLTPRRRYILFAARVDGKRLRDIASELGISQRLVEKELQSALRLCGASLQRKPVQRFGPRQVQASTEKVARGLQHENAAGDAGLKQR